MEISMWNIEAMTGYQPKTTFWMDFSIVDKFGKGAVLDTYKRAFENWKDDPVYLTELVMVLNWKLWEHHEKNEALAEVYQDLWTKADVYAMENLIGEDLNYFLRTTKRSVTAFGWKTFIQATTSLPSAQDFTS